MSAWNPYAVHECGDCGVPEGHLHDLGCDQETCPFCAGQLISCDCRYTLLGIKDQRYYDQETDYLPPIVYCEGLSDADEERWERMLEARGRVPFIAYPPLCSRCGCHWPAMFRVPEDVWKHYIDPAVQDRLLCEQCWAFIVTVINAQQPWPYDGAIERIGVEQFPATEGDGDAR